MSEFWIRQLTPDDLLLLKSLRLEALASDPDEFGSTYRDEVDRPDDDWRRWTTRGAVFVAEHAVDGPVGLAAGWRDAGGENIVWVASMWVRATHRGSGAGDALLAAVLDWARSEGIATVRLKVGGGNVRATKLYTRHGFYPSGNITVNERDGGIEIEMQRD
jgi:GNAT superfamily N-acetyltransferase